MGRSRLAYRAKHKGILSKSSRQQIQEARQARNQNSVSPVQEQIESDDITENTFNEDEVVEEILDEGNVDLFSEPKLYYLESEYNNFVNQIKMEEHLQTPLLCVIPLYSFHSLDSKQNSIFII